MQIQFVDPKHVKQPKGSLILEERVGEDYVMGGDKPNNPKKLGKTVLKGGHWRDFAPGHEIQRVADGDTMGCTGYSDNNADEMLHKCKYGTEVNISDMFVVVASGTSVERGGNTMKAPAQLKHSKGWLWESEYPYSRSMTLKEFYKPITEQLMELAAVKLNFYDSNYMFLGGASQEYLLAGLEMSPLKVAIEGRYVFDNNGRLMITGSGYNHAVVLFDYELINDVLGPIPGNVKEWWIFDSETEQYLKARADYAFVSPMIKFLEKKTMKMYKKNGQAAIGFVNESKDGLIMWSDGQDNLGRPVTGGSIFKTMGLSYSMAEPCDEWPLPIVGYAQVVPQV
jgi:hypothetical protein